MTDHFVTVGDDLALPSAVKVLDGNLPAESNAAAVAAKASIKVQGVNALTGKVHVDAFGAKGDAQGRNSCAMTAGSAVLTSSGGNFLSTAVPGQVMAVAGAGAAGAALVTTIASVQSDTQVTLTAAAATTVTAANHMYGTDDSAAINAALLAASLAKAPVAFNARAYFASGLTAYSGVLWEGASVGGDLFGTSTNNFGGTTLLTTPGANVTLIRTKNFAALTGGTSTTGAPERFGFRDIVFDGSALNGYNTSGFLMELYGASYSVDACIFQYGASGGVWTEWGSGGYEMESYWNKFHFKSNGGTSLHVKGPHDSMFHMGQVSGGGAGTKGIWVDGGGAAGAQFNQVHVWGSFDWGWYVTNGSTYVNCKSEGSTIGQFYLGAGDVHLSATELFNGPNAIGLQIGDTSIYPSYCTIDIKITGCATPIKVVTDSGFNTVKADINVVAGAAPWTGSWADSSLVQITADKSVGSHDHGGSWQIPADVKLIKSSATALSINNDGVTPIVTVDTTGTPAGGVIFKIKAASGTSADTLQCIDQTGTLRFGVTSSGINLGNNSGGTPTANIRNAAGRVNFSVTDVTGAVNYPALSNAPTGSGAVYGVTGSDTNIDVALVPKGTGSVKTASDVEITDATKGVVLKSPNGTRYRVTVGDDGALTTTAL